MVCPRRIVLSIGAASLVIACAPGLTAPGESIRISGRVSAATPGPIRVAVFEQCSPRYVFFEECPGEFLGEAKIAGPGEFVVEIDPEGAAIAVYAFRGLVGREHSCGHETVDLSVNAPSPAALELVQGPCEAALDLR